MVPGMFNCVLHVEWQFSRTHSIWSDCSISVVTSGAISLVWGFMKNVIGQLKFSKRPMLQKIGCLAYNAIDSIGWISYCGWMLKPEGAKCVYLEAYLEKWLVLSALMIFTWWIAERFVHQYGSWAWKLFKAQYALNCQSRRNHWISLPSL